MSKRKEHPDWQGPLFGFLSVVVRVAGQVLVVLIKWRGWWF